MNSENPNMAPLSKDEQNFATLMYLSPFIGFIFPFGGILAPLILWLWKRKEAYYLDVVGKEVLNFSISYAIYGAVAGILCWLLIGWVLLPVVFVAGIVLTIIGAIRSSKGEFYSFPYILRLIA